MTNLGHIIRFRAKDYAIYLSISGDLSHSYQLIHSSSIKKKSIGLGYAFTSLSKAKNGLIKARKLGYGSQMFRGWYEPIGFKSKYRYLSFLEAKKYLGKRRIMEAYGEVAESYKKKLKKGLWETSR